MITGVNINGMNSEDPKLKPYGYFFLFNVDPNSLPKNLLKILRQRKKNLMKTEF